jgi:hypothetical protein
MDYTILGAKATNRGNAYAFLKIEYIGVLHIPANIKERNQLQKIYIYTKFSTTKVTILIRVTMILINHRNN